MNSSLCSQFSETAWWILLASHQQLSNYRYFDYFLIYILACVFDESVWNLTCVKFLARSSSITCRFLIVFVRNKFQPLAIGVILSSCKVRQLWVLITNYSINIFVEHWTATGTTNQSQCFCKISNFSLQKPIYKLHTLNRTRYRILVCELPVYILQECRSGRSPSFASVTRSLIFQLFLHAISFLNKYFEINT